MKNTLKITITFIALITSQTVNAIPFWCLRLSATHVDLQKQDVKHPEELLNQWKALVHKEKDAIVAWEFSSEYRNFSMSTIALIELLKTRKHIDHVRVHLQDKTMYLQLAHSWNSSNLLGRGGLFGKYDSCSEEKIKEAMETIFKELPERYVAAIDVWPSRKRRTANIWQKIGISKTEDDLFSASIVICPLQ
jgi:hypothetical protein